MNWAVYMTRLAKAAITQTTRRTGMIRVFRTNRGRYGPTSLRLATNDRSRRTNDMAEKGYLFGEGEREELPLGFKIGDDGDVVCREGLPVDVVVVFAEEGHSLPLPLLKEADEDEAARDSREGVEGYAWNSKRHTLQKR